MAEKMFISEQTVKTTCNIFDKLGVSTAWNSRSTRFAIICTPAGKQLAGGHHPRLGDLWPEFNASHGVYSA
jgi:hypothetical protein